MYELGKIARRITVAVFVVLSLTLAAQAKYSGGSGEPNSPYQIANYEDLYALADDANDYNKCFIQTSNIDLDQNLPGRRTLNKALIAPDTSTSPGFQGKYFTGTYDGNGYRILNLRIQGKDYIGLFGYIYTGGYICNLGLEDVNVTGTGSEVGGLVGQSYSGSVTNCYATGVVTGNGNYAGGLVGIASYGSITNCYATGAVIGNYYVGGLVGNTYQATVTNCYTAGTVTGSDVGAGGLLGTMLEASMANCYTTGAVTGNERVGGLVGEAAYASTTNCYATGQVIGNRDVGGLVGYKESSNVTSSFWDVNTSGTTVSAGGIGLTTSQMHQTFYFAANNWAGTTWTIDEGNDYPHLAWENKPGQFITDPVVSLPGSGTAEDPWVIESKEDFLLVCAGTFFWDKHYVLNTDIDLSGVIYTHALIGDDMGGPFNGSFDGGGHVISGLTIEGGDYLGLFGCIGSGGSLSNLGLEDISIATGFYVGGLAGYADHASVMNCYATEAVVSGWYYTGGLVGYAVDTNVSTCYATCEVTGDYYVGGLVGSAPGVIVSNSCAHSAVTGTYYVGGLMGHTSSSCVTGSYAGGTIKGLYSVGGLLGRAENAIVTNCYATGPVTGYWEAGGVVGSVYSRSSVTIMTNCYGTGAVSGAGYVGGLVGYKGVNATLTVANSFWDTQTTRTSDGVGNVNPDPKGAMGTTTAQMMTLSTFTVAGWDFDTPVWVMWDGHEYPWLAWEWEPVEVESISVVDRERVGRTVFRYECRLTLWDTRPQNVWDVNAELIDVPENVTIVDGNAGCASIAPFSLAESNDTFTIEVDRSILIEPTEMTWHISYSYDDGTGRTIYETATSTTIFEQTADITGDGKVNIADLTSLVSKWLWQGQPGEIIQDIYQDGRVDLLDLCELAMNWVGQ